MHSFEFSRPSYLVLLGLFLFVNVAGYGQAIISNGASPAVLLGINEGGSTNVLDTTGIGHTDSGYLGLAYFGVNSGFSGTPPGDANAPGCQCEGWGIAANGLFAGSSDVSTGGMLNGIKADSFTSTASSAVVTNSSLSQPITVVQDYHVAAGAPANAFEDLVTITNTGTSTLTGVSYARVMDFDVPPTEFDEFITLHGNGATNLISTSDDGFALPDPTTAFSAITGCGTANTDFTHCGPADHGAAFAFNFGALTAGSSISFSVFYGAALDELSALTALSALGAEVFALGESTLASGGPATGSGTFFFGFKGVGGTPLPPPTEPPPTAVPEPSSLAMFGVSGLLVIGWRMGRRGKTSPSGYFLAS